MTLSRRRRIGFTLIEIMIVLAILVALGGGGVLIYMRTQESARKKIAQNDINELVQKVGLYTAAVGKLPDSDKGFDALLKEPDDDKEKQKWKDGGGPFLEKAPVDPWNNAYKYQKLDDTSGGAGFHIWSTGPDGQDGNEDDIKSWTDEQK